MIDRVAADLSEVPVATERLPGRPGFGDTLVARTHEGRPGILILSHIDTVHPVGTLATSPCRRDGDRLYGPGVYDMKGGAYLALDAFRRVMRGKAARLPITFLFTPDEEIGSPCSRELIEREGRRARYVLVTEPARDGGKVVTSRKGVGRFEAVTTGVPAHSGSRHRDGHSAIDEMARQILAASPPMSARFPAAPPPTSCRSVAGSASICAFRTKAPARKCRRRYSASHPSMPA